MIRYTKPRAVIAAIQLPTDHTGELEFANIITRFPRVVLRVQKADCDGFTGCNAESYNLLINGIDRAVATLKPKSTLNAIGLACTSMSYVIGLEETASILKNNIETATHVTSIGASLIKAIHYLKIKSVALICPYTEDLTRIIIDQLSQRGINVMVYEHFNITDDTMIEQIDPEFIKERAIASSSPDIDCIVMCCSAMRVTNLIDDIEYATDKRVIASSQAFIWDLLRLSGINDRVNGLGQLFLL